VQLLQTRQFLNQCSYSRPDYRALQQLQIRPTELSSCYRPHQTTELAGATDYPTKILSSRDVHQPQTRLQRCAGTTLENEAVQLLQARQHSCADDNESGQQNCGAVAGQTTQHLGSCLQNRLHSHASARQRPTEL
jgi:hypothetical protein